MGIASAIRAEMAAQQVTETTLSALTGIEGGRLRKVLNRDGTVTVPEAERIAAALGIPLSALALRAWIENHRRCDNNDNKKEETVATPQDQNATDRHATIRAAHAIIDCLMIEAARAGITITNVDVTTYNKIDEVNIGIMSDRNASLVSILGLKARFHFECNNEVVASCVRSVGRWSVKVLDTVGTVETHGHLLDNEGE